MTEFVARSQERGADKVQVAGHPVFVTLETPCRECSQCLRARANLWRLRAKSEVERSTRTWMGTFTLSPENHYRMLCRAKQRLSAVSVVFESLSPQEQFIERHRECSKELTLWLKRTRKALARPFTYLLVCEAHQSGLPHYHMLLHEADQSRPVRHVDLKGTWKLGFDQWRLADAAASGYLAKYLSKSILARVRASIDYGAEDPELEKLVRKARCHLRKHPPKTDWHPRSYWWEEVVEHDWAAPKDPFPATWRDKSMVREYIRRNEGFRSEVRNHASLDLLSSSEERSPDPPHDQTKTFVESGD